MKIEKKEREEIIFKMAFPERKRERERERERNVATKPLFRLLSALYFR